MTGILNKIISKPRSLITSLEKQIVKIDLNKMTDMSL